MPNETTVAIYTVCCRSCRVGGCINPFHGEVSGHFELIVNIQHAAVMDNIYGTVYYAAAELCSVQHHQPRTVVSVMGGGHRRCVASRYQKAITFGPYPQSIFTACVCMINYTVWISSLTTDTELHKAPPTDASGLYLSQSGV